jgi:hypothetical protein
LRKVVTDWARVCIERICEGALVASNSLDVLVNNIIDWECCLAAVHCLAISVRVWSGWDTALREAHCLDA